MMAADPKIARTSTRLTRKGALIVETYHAFQHWDVAASVAENLRRIRETNVIGAPNEAWLNEVVVTLSNRFTHDPHLRSLVTVAQSGLALEEWKPCLLWHTARTDHFYFRFLTEWLFPEHARGRFAIQTDAVIPFVEAVTVERAGSKGALSEYGTCRAARDLLRMARDFGLLEGSSSRHFVTYHLPEEAFLYVLHGIAEGEHNGRRVIDSPDWRVFLMSPDAVEREILSLHQFRRLNYESAGSLAQLTLPFPSLQLYAESMKR